MLFMLLPRPVCNVAAITQTEPCFSSTIQVSRLSLLSLFNFSWISQLLDFSPVSAKHASYPANVQHCHSFSCALPLLLSSLHLSPCLSWRAVVHFVLQIWESPQTPSWISSHLSTRKKKKNLSVCTRLNKKKTETKNKLRAEDMKSFWCSLLCQSQMAQSSKHEKDKISPILKQEW